MTTGKCNHGEFDLLAGCPQCIEERRTSLPPGGLAEAAQKAGAEVTVANIPSLNIVKVRYGDAPEGREYSYFSKIDLEVGDRIIAPTKKGSVKARVSAIGIPFMEVENFKNSMQTITERVALAVMDTKVNLCDTCINRLDYPVCSPNDVEFGDGKGNDNIIKCSKYTAGPAGAVSLETAIKVVADMPDTGPSAEDVAETVKAFQKVASGDISAVDDLIEAVNLPLSEEAAMVALPGSDSELVKFYVEAQRLQTFAEALNIQDTDSHKKANDDLSLISKIKKAMGDKKKAVLEPHKAQGDAFRATFNTLMAPIVEADRLTRAALLAYDAKVRADIAEAERINALRIEAAQREAAMNHGEITESLDLITPKPEPKPVATGQGTTGTMANWKAEVVDFAALPDEYKLPDMAMLGTIARKHHDAKSVPGVRFFNQPTIVNRVR